MGEVLQLEVVVEVGGGCCGSGLVRVSLGQPRAVKEINKNGWETKEDGS